MAWISTMVQDERAKEIQSAYESSPYKNLTEEFTASPDFYTGALEFATSPLVGKLMEGIQKDLGIDYEGIYKNIGRRTSAEQTRMISNTLASSGRSGSLGAALSTGAQARNQAEAGAFGMGMQARQSAQDTALNAATFMTNSMLGLLTQQSGYMSNMLNYAAARQAAEAQEKAGLWSAVGAWLGNSPKG